VLKAYKDFYEMVGILGSLQIKPFDEAALREFNNMSGAGHVGVRDRRMAAIALANDFTVVTNNERDFDAIKVVRPELRIENWARRAYSSRIS
jgi:predicted nucleic acid-binding protein